MMAAEELTVIALPRSADPERDFHVSLFISPHLTPRGATGELSEFANFARWPQALADARSAITLFGGIGAGGEPITAEPLLERLRPQLWSKVFPGSTPVKGRPQPQPPENLLSFPVHRMDENALNLHATALAEDPVHLPPALGDAFGRVVAAQLPGGERGLRDLTLERLLDPDFDVQAAFTAALTSRAARLQPVLRSGVEKSPSGRAPRFTAGAAFLKVERGLGDQLLDVHQARLYYEKLAPPAEVSHPSPTPPEPDFHERCALLAGTPHLLRWLGLVVDLKVEDLEALRQARWIRGRIEIGGIGGGGPTRAPRTACHTRAETGFFATPVSEDWNDGWLRLSHPKGLFTVLDLDPDASALNVERHWRNLVRLAAAEKDGEKVNAAPPALRASGFSIARKGRAEALAAHLKRAGEDAAAREQGDDRPLALEDVARGLRLEVWDDVERSWRSLHERRLAIEVDGEEVAKGERDVGYVKGGMLVKGVAEDDAPQQLHETIAGWEGWSLSAPPPGKTVLPDGSLGEPMPEPISGTPVTIRSRIERGTLPRLRYGRSYAFRIASVDLAGNSPPHKLGPAPEPNPELVATIAPLLESRGAASAPSAFARELLSHVREARPLPEPASGEGVSGIDLGQLELSGEPEVDRLLAPRLARRAESLRAIGPTRMTRVEHAFTDALHETDALLAPTAPDPDALDVARLIGDLVGAAAEEQAPGVFERLLDLVTKPRPFLRWDPVPPPTIVPRHPFSAGESLQTLVIRSGVELSDKGEIEVVGAADFAASIPGYGYRATSERHMAAPKASQREAERHGKFDDAIGSKDASARRRALAIALRESGTFLDTEIADLSRPGKTVPQPGVLVVSGPDGDAAPPAVERGEPLPRGQYAIHDVDQPVLPYLADPPAAGVSLVFPDAGSGHRLRFPWSTEGLRLDYRGEWPQLGPYRLVLESGEELAGRVDGNAIRIALPPGTELRLRSSSALAPRQLELLGLWRTRPQAYRSRAEIVEAARDGWLWWLTPFDEVRLVHAVPRPVEAPRAVGLRTDREADGTGAGLLGVIDLHGPSTGRVDLESSWTERVDDPSADQPSEAKGGATAWGTEVSPEEDFLALVGEERSEGSEAMPDGQVVHLHHAKHEFGDTKHRVVDYRVRATTRFREYFEQTPPLSAEDLSLLGPVARVSVPSSARPPKPLVHDVLPLFRWDQGTEPEQPFGLRRTRRAGVRVYLERPWWVSGDGELLGLVLGPAAGGRKAGDVATSVWAGDPVWEQNGPEKAHALPLRDLLETLEPETLGEPGRPVRPPARLPVVDVPGSPTVSVLGYQPEYNQERRLWFADITFDQGTAFWPFVRLALARYQPESIGGKHLSPIVACDFAQLAPDRIATVARPGERQVRVVLTGPVGFPHDARRRKLPEDRDSLEARLRASRTVRARLERRDPEIGTDLGWKALEQIDLELRGFEEWNASWVGTLELPRRLPPSRPGARRSWRVAIEEWERLSADPPPRSKGIHTEARLVYTDHLYL